MTRTVTSLGESSPRSRTPLVERFLAGSRPGPARSRYRKLQPRWCGLDKDEIAADQRRRLYEAMIEITASRGYESTTITALWSTAGVSSHTFYALFPKSQGDPKEVCFLGAYDYAVRRAMERITRAYRAEQNPEDRLYRAFEQFAWEVA